MWLLDLTHDVVEIHREPTQKGYCTVRIARRGESMAPKALADCYVAVSDLLPDPYGGISYIDRA